MYVYILHSTGENSGHRDEYRHVGSRDTNTQIAAFHNHHFRFKIIFYSSPVSNYTLK